MTGRMSDDSKFQKIKQIRLEKAGFADAPRLLALVVAAFHEYDGYVLPPSGAHRETTESICRRLAAGTATVAVIDGVDAGCIFSAAHEDGYVYFSRLSVLPHFRNRGVARVLIEDVESLARANGAPGVRLGVRLQLEHLIVRYERLGYRITKLLTHDGYDEATYVYMEKVLDQ